MCIRDRYDRTPLRSELLKLESVCRIMPRIDFSLLPDDARLWIFAAAEPVIGDRAALLLARVDAYLEQWKAHGSPLTCSRDWREERFLAIAVDQQSTGASGCSIDALFRILQE